MSVRDVDTAKEYNKYRNQGVSKDNKNGLVVVKCSTEWCGPCKQIQPAYEALAEKYDGFASFLHVDVETDDLIDLDDLQDIRGVPTFKFIKNGKEVDAVSGASISKVKALLDKHCKIKPE